jgi:hypothetical protein
MPGVIDSYFYLAFRRDRRGHAVPAGDVAQAGSEAEAIRLARQLAESHDGAVAWTRHAETALGEIGPAIVLFSTGKIGDFD